MAALQAGVHRTTIAIQNLFGVSDKQRGELTASDHCKCRREVGHSTVPEYPHSACSDTYITACAATLTSRAC